jgi:hypothetical protein
LNNEAAAEWKSNKKAAETKAKDFTKKYANWLTQLSKNSIVLIDSNYN